MKPDPSPPNLGSAALIGIITFIMISIGIVVAEGLNRVDAELAATQEFVSAWILTPPHVIDPDVLTSINGPAHSTQVTIGGIDGALSRLNASPTLAILVATGRVAPGDRQRSAELWREYQAFAERRAMPSSGSPRATLDALRRVMYQRLIQLTRVSSDMHNVQSRLAFLGLLGLLALTALSTFQNNRLTAVQAKANHAKELIQAALEAQDRERTRLALELHDTVAQELAAASMQASRISDSQTGIRAILLQLIGSCLDRVRNLAGELYAPDLNRRDFIHSVGELIAQLNRQYPVRFSFHCSGDAAWNLSVEGCIHLYRIIQEALNNVILHAKASVCPVVLELAPNRVIVTISDDGVGFDDRNGDSTPGHFGLSGMRERAALLGAEIRWVSSRGNGTTIHIEVPYD